MKSTVLRNDVSNLLSNSLQEGEHNLQQMKLKSAAWSAKGFGCDLLIHEATFCDTLEHDALAKNHSTTSQAIHVAHEMRARFTILTHFSQRYSRTPVFTDKFTDDIGFAFDLMKVTMDDLHVIPRLKEVLEPFFHDYDFMKKIWRKRQVNAGERRRTDVNIYDRSIPKRSRPDNSDKDIIGPARETAVGKAGCETEKTIGVEGIFAEKL